MYNLYLSNHFEAPMILNPDTDKAKEIFLQMKIRGINLYKIHSGIDMDSSIQAWERLKVAIQTNQKNYSFN